MLRLWRNIQNKPAELDRRVRRTQAASVMITLPAAGNRAPLVRLNALPIVSIPTKCRALSFSKPKEWPELHDAERSSEGGLILTKSDSVWCWGAEETARKEFKDVTGVSELDFSDRLKHLDENLYLKGFLEAALCRALASGKPLLYRTSRHTSFLIADRHAEDHVLLDPAGGLAGNPFGDIAGLFTESTDEHPDRRQIAYAEARSSPLTASVSARALTPSND